MLTSPQKSLKCAPLLRGNPRGGFKELTFQVSAKVADLTFESRVLNLLQRKFKKTKKNVDFKTRLRRMRISLRARPAATQVKRMRFNLATFSK